VSAVPQVAFEAVSVSAHPGRKPGAQADHKGSTQFADMLDDASTNGDTKTPSPVEAAPQPAQQNDGKTVAGKYAVAAPAVQQISVNVDTVPAVDADQTSDKADTDAAPDQSEIDALLAAIAEATGLPVTPVTDNTAAKTAPSDACADKTDKTDDADKTKASDKKLEAATATPATPATAVAAVVVTPVVTDAATPATDPAPTTAVSGDSTAKTAVAKPDSSKADDAAIKALATGDAQLEGKAEAKTDAKVETTIETNIEAKAEAKAQPSHQDAKPQVAAKTDTVPPAPAANKNDATKPAAAASAQSQPAQPAGIAPAHTADRNASHDAGSAKTPAAQHELAAPDTTPTGKPADVSQPLPLLQANTVAQPASTTSVASPSQPPQAAALPVAGIAVEIAAKAFEGKNRFEIRLDPPELGRIHVRLDVDHKGEVTSIITADRSDTFDMLRRDAQSLERALQDAGVKTSNNGLQFSLRDQGFGRNDQPVPMHDSARIVVRDQSLDTEIIAPVYRTPNGLRAGVDIRV
jgi:flagellar hook-length control protein FliK